MTMGLSYVPSRGTGDSTASAKLNRDPLGGAGESSTREGNILDPLIGAGEEPTTVGFCPISCHFPQGLLDLGHGFEQARGGCRGRG